MITLTRRDINHVRAVLRRAGLARLAAGGPLNLSMVADTDGIRIRAGSPDLVAEYHLERSQPADRLLVPFSVLDACSARDSEPVQFTSTSSGQLEVEWRDRGIPQMLVEPSPDSVSTYDGPDVPAESVTLDRTLWQAFADAAATSTTDSSRFALDAIQFRGTAREVIATDGRQAFIEGGFQFPWSEDLLIPASRLFGCREIVPGDMVQLGHVDGWFYLATAGWRFWIRTIREKRFPDVAAIVRHPEHALSRLHLASGDAKFLLEALPRLPESNLLNHPVTFDLNGKVLVRAKSADTGHAMELVLSESHLEGEPVTFVANRQYLMRALALGFDELLVFGADAPIQCRRGNRHYVFATLTSSGAVPSKEGITRVTSRLCHSTGATSPQRCRSPQRRMNGGAKAIATAA